jgi:hypothetical protein
MDYDYLHKSNHSPSVNHLNQSADNIREQSLIEIIPLCMSF